MRRSGDRSVSVNTYAMQTYATQNALVPSQLVPLPDTAARSGTGTPSEVAPSVMSWMRDTPG
jgi:hypothetical protein